MDPKRNHSIEAVVDRLVINDKIRSRLTDSVEMALKQGHGTLIALLQTGKDRWEAKVYSEKNACLQCGISFDALTPHNFSFNSQLGWCPDCEGIGTQTGAGNLGPGRQYQKESIMTTTFGALIPADDSPSKVFARLFLEGTTAETPAAPTDIAPTDTTPTDTAATNTSTTDTVPADAASTDPPPTDAARPRRRRCP